MVSPWVLSKERILDLVSKCRLDGMKSIAYPIILNLSIDAVVEGLAFHVRGLDCLPVDSENSNDPE